jgi:hypothetical protein
MAHARCGAALRPPRTRPFGRGCQRRSVRRRRADHGARAGELRETVEPCGREIEREGKASDTSLKRFAEGWPSPVEGVRLEIAFGLCHLVSLQLACYWFRSMLVPASGLFRETAI